MNSRDEALTGALTGAATLQAATLQAATRARQGADRAPREPRAACQAGLRGGRQEAYRPRATRHATLTPDGAPNRQAPVREAR